MGTVATPSTYFQSLMCCHLIAYFLQIKVKLARKRCLKLLTFWNFDRAPHHILREVYLSRLHYAVKTFSMLSLHIYNVHMWHLQTLSY